MRVAFMNSQRQRDGIRSKSSMRIKQHRELKIGGSERCMGIS